MTDKPPGTGADGPPERVPGDGALPPQAASALPLRELGELTQALLAAPNVEDVLRKIIIAVRYLIPTVDLVSITLREGDGRYHTPLDTDAEALELDHVQYDTREGPCLDAADPDGPAYAHSGDLTGETPWPVFAAAAAARGYASILSTALLSAPEPAPFTGALNIYSRRHDGLDATARDTAFLLATYASLALRAAHEAERAGRADHVLTEVRTEAANLRRALDTRTVIGQAMGILIARRHLNADQAFEILKRASQTHNVKLAHLAQLLTRHPETVDRI